METRNLPSNLPLSFKLSLAYPFRPSLKLSLAYPFRPCAHLSLSYPFRPSRYSLSSGPGIIVPANIVENLVILFLVLISGVLWANIIGQICGIAAAGDPVLNEFHAVNDDLNRFMETTAIPIESRMHVRM
jgi:hypothetical protein